MYVSVLYYAEKEFQYLYYLKITFHFIANLKAYEQIMYYDLFLLLFYYFILF